jgi:glycosyltransferase involved in cell wall biosynthesis
MATLSPCSVSLAITTYNHAQYLGEAIESVLAQTVAPSEIIVVDDGSTDHPEIVAEKYPGVRLIRQSNQGLAGARNTGLAAATGEFIAFLDADDRLLPRALEVNLWQFDEHPECAFVYAAHTRIDNAGRTVMDIPFREMEADAYATFLSGNVVGMHATVLYRRNRLIEAGKFDARFAGCEDYAMYLELSRHYPVVGRNENLAEYRWHDSNMSRNSARMLRHILRLLRYQRPVADTRPEWKRALDFSIRKWKLHYTNEYLRGPFSEGPVTFGKIWRLAELYLLAPEELKRAARRIRKERRELEG